MNKSDDVIKVEEDFDWRVDAIRRSKQVNLWGRRPWFDLEEENQPYLSTFKYLEYLKKIRNNLAWLKIHYPQSQRLVQDIEDIF